MKKTAISLSILAVAVSSFGQGQVAFNNRIAGTTGFVTPIYGVNPAAPSVRISGNSTTNANPGTANYTGVPYLTGSGFTASLWEGNVLGATDMGQFHQIGGTSGFRPDTAGQHKGIILNSSVGTSEFASGSTATFQVRAWDNKAGAITTWANALAAHQRGETAAGWSDAFSNAVGGGTGLPSNLTGLRSFNLTIVPEPSLIALGALGFGALLLRRRK